MVGVVVVMLVEDHRIRVAAFAFDGDSQALQKRRLVSVGRQITLFKFDLKAEKRDVVERNITYTVSQTER